MDFELTADQREIQELTRDLAEAEIVPNAAAWDREHRFPHELFPKLAELGLMAVCVPEEYGGAGADFLSYVLVPEELSRADAGRGVTNEVALTRAPADSSSFGQRRKPGTPNRAPTRTAHTQRSPGRACPAEWSTRSPTSPGCS